MDLITLAAAKKGSNGGGGTLTPATTTKLGGVKVGDGLSIDNTGVLSADNSILLLGSCNINTSSDTITSSSINSNNFDAIIQSAPSGGFPTIQCTLIVNQTNTATGYNFYCVGINNPASNTYLIRMAGIINRKIYILQVSSSSVVGINAYDISSYTLPKASTSTLGGIKVGSGLSIDNNGVLSASGGSGSVNVIIVGYTSSVYPSPATLEHTDGTTITYDELASIANTVVTAFDTHFGVAVLADIQKQIDDSIEIAYQTSRYDDTSQAVMYDKVMVHLASGETPTVTVDSDTFSGGSYTLPTASATTLGGVKVGSGLAIDSAGVLSASGGSTENVIIYTENTDGTDSVITCNKTYEEIAQIPNNEPVNVVFIQHIEEEGETYTRIFKGNSFEDADPFYVTHILPAGSEDIGSTQTLVCLHIVHGPDTIDKTKSNLEIVNVL